MSVSLWVCWSIVVVPDSKFTTISPKSIAVELCSVVRYEGVRPNHVTMFLYMNFFTAWSRILANGSTSTLFVK